MKEDRTVKQIVAEIREQFNLPKKHPESALDRILRKSISRFYYKTIVSLSLSFWLIFFGVRWIVFRPGGTLRGIAASFSLVTGIQIALWFFGIRTELFGTAPDPVSPNEFNYEYSLALENATRTAVNQQGEIEELRTKLSQAARRADLP